MTLSIANSVARHFKALSYLNSSWSQVLSCTPVIQPPLTMSVTPWMQYRHLSAAENQGFGAF